MDGVKECDVRMDHVGKKPSITVHVLLDGNPGYETIHSISSKVDREVRAFVPNARVSIRSEPESGSRGRYDSIWDLVKRIAEHEPGSRGAHNIHLQDMKGELGVDFHLEVSSGMSVKQAYEVATRVEKKLKAANPNITEVVIHTETTSESVSSERAGHGTELKWYLVHVLKRFPEATLWSPPVIRRLGEKRLHVIIHASLNPNLSMDKANQLTSKIEAAVKDGYPGIARVDIVTEPSGADPPELLAGRP